jgi:hypothetical protein
LLAQSQSSTAQGISIILADFISFCPAGLDVAQKTAPNRMQILKDIVGFFGLTAEEILTREALEKSHRIVI